MLPCILNEGTLSGGAFSPGLALIRQEPGTSAPKNVPHESVTVW